MTTKKQLKFALLARVSTEEQGKRGHSIDEQVRQCERAIDSLNGKLVKTYAGQQHSTKGADTYLFDEILQDALTNKWDALLTAFPDRFSRDNVKASQGLDILRKNKKRFFVLSKEYDLWNTDDRFFLSMSYLMAQKSAEDYAQRSRNNRMDAARQINSQGYNNCVSTPPYGRIWDKEKKLWSVDNDKKRIVEKAAELYLNDGNFKSYAKNEANMTVTNLLKTIRVKSGGTMQVKFKRTEINPQDEVLTLKIPRLLSEKVIKAVAKKADERRTFEVGQPPKHSYLLTGHIFCGHCEKALTGQTYTSGGRHYAYYRHDTKNKCMDHFNYFRAVELEELVYNMLIKKLSDHKQLFEATKKATPTINDQTVLQKKITKAEAGLKQIKKQIDTIVEKISLSLLSDDDAKTILTKLHDKRQYFSDQIDELKAELRPLPTEEQIKHSAQLMSQLIKHSLMAEDEEVVRYAKKVSTDKKRKLTDLVFSGTDQKGRRYGVYMFEKDAETFKIQIKGHYFTADGAHINVDTYKYLNKLTYKLSNTYNDLSFIFNIMVSKRKWLKLAA